MQAEGLTGAEIEGVCREAAMLALRKQGIHCSEVNMR
jgi:SpoVK/Ycf46/Vps4 family AAA+-type ATPase